MKRLLALLLMLAFAITISACGPNSDYYNLGSKNFYYYNDEPLIVNPYELFVENNDWLDLSSQARLKTPERFYEVKVEWRKNGSHDSFEELEVVDNMIKFDDPRTIFRFDRTYDFKIHFIEDGDKDNMINYYGVFTFFISPANVDKKEIDKKINDTYTLLSNVIEYDPTSGQPLTNNELTNIYDVVYEVTLDDEDVTVTDGDVTFTQVGTYLVDIQLTKKAAETDAVSSASESGGDAEKMILNIHYTINVTE